MLMRNSKPFIHPTVLAMVGAIITAGANACPPIELLVPAYQYPTIGSMWSMLGTAPQPATAGVRVTVILNPASGPGMQADPTYVASVAAARAAGARIVGYITTSYGVAAESSIIAQAQAYQAFYGIDGVFLDELNNTPAALAYNQSITAAIHSALPGTVVFANPGTSVPESYIAQNAADVLVTYENDRVSATEAYAMASPPAWAALYPASRFANIVYNAPDAPTMRSVVALARQRNVGVLYITDDVFPTPYDTLASYWNDELIAAHGCPADFDCSGGLAVADIFAFLNAWFAGSPAANFDGMNGLQVADIFAFLNAWFAGCP